MPLIDLSSGEALDNRRGNRFGTWGDRSAANRVEPVAKPAFDVPFRLEAGDAVFTIGSCFARNVERVLAERGFRLPMLDVFRQPEFAKIDRRVVNNYAAPAIYNELAWAFGREPYPEDLLIAEARPGRFVDLNLTPTLRPEPRETVLQRRRALNEAYRASASCRLIVITLGLSEVWFDTASGTYLNVSPRPAAMKAEPERFRLHVLSYQETVDYLRAAIALLRDTGRPDARVLLTVSPVPLAATHRDQDVLLANMYSKSVLRTAAEAVVAGDPAVSYFPSYESFMLTDRKRAFIDDLIHTQMDLVTLNVDRMVDAYTASAETAGTLRRAIEAGGEVAAVDKANSVAPELADAFFQDHGAWSARSLEFAKAEARHLIRTKRYDAAFATLNDHAVGDDLEQIALLTEAALKAGRADDALGMMDNLPAGRVKAPQVWDNLLAAAIKSDRSDMIVVVLARLVANVRSRAPAAYLQAARHFQGRGDRDRAARLYQQSYEESPTNGVALEYAQALLEQGRSEEAHAVLGRIVPGSRTETQRLEQLSALV